MRIRILGWSSGALATAILIAGGCAQQANEPTTAASDQEPPAAAPESEHDQVATTAATPAVDVQPATATEPVRVEANVEEPAPLPHGPRAPIPLEEPVDSGTAMPAAYFTEAHAATNKVGVGDAFPPLELADLQGEKHSLDELAGERATVVTFWTAKRRAATEDLADLQSLVAERFAESGVAVIGVNVGDDPQLAAELVEQAGAKFVNLADGDGAAWRQVASDKLPRTYLLDASGKVAWFDIEFSRTTRQNLVAGIRFLLNQ